MSDSTEIEIIDPEISDDALPKLDGLVNLPTGKPHVSFSEVSNWRSCGWRHKLDYIDKVAPQIPSVHMDFGTSVHATIENFVHTRQIDNKILLTQLHQLWVEHAGKLPPETPPELQYTPETLKTFAQQGKSILRDVPQFFDTQFPGWTAIDAEHLLYERLSDHPEHAFKGFIDIVIQAPNKQGQPVIWVIDAKTCSWGWKSEKKNDVQLRAQLVLYKNFWTNKTGTDPSTVKCGFLLLKRTAKPGAHCELVRAYVGEVTTKHTLKVVNDMVTSVKKGVAIKNRTSCKFCPHFQTPNCT